MSSAHININHAALEHILYEDDCQKLTKRKARELIAAAKAIYLSQRVLPDHNDYLGSFEITKEGKSWIVYNTDDTAFWVEFGAHAGGKTYVLGYAPMRLGLDAIAE